MKVTATAYNSFASPPKHLANTRSVFVSRDLIAKGLTHNTMVKIDRLERVFLVKGISKNWLFLSPEIF